MFRDGSDDLSRRDVLRTTTAIGAAATGLGASGSATAKTIPLEDRVDGDLHAALERETEGLRSQLSDLGYLPDESVDRFNLDVLDVGIDAGTEETGMHATVKESGVSLVSISHNTDAANMALFVKPQVGEAHAVVEAEGERHLVTDDGTVKPMDWECDTHEYCDLGCGCEEDKEPRDHLWDDPEYSHQEKGILIKEECCVPEEDPFTSSCTEVHTTPCRGCRSDWKSGRC